MSAQPSSVTAFGLAGIRSVPYGTHMCHFYRDARELADVVVPYLAAGLRARERCIWVCATPLEAEAAARGLAQLGVSIEKECHAGRLQILDHQEWYLQQGELSVSEVCQLWIAEEERALADGYAGLRITGNVTFLTAETWPQFMEYERAAEETFARRRIVALCSYPRRGCGAAEVLDVVHRHSCTLERPGQGWQILTPHAA